jgi:chromosomal replication initiator protein
VTDCQVLWDKVLSVVRSSTSQAVFQSFFSVVHPLSLTEDRFIVQIDSPLVADWLRQKYARLIEDRLSELAGRRVTLVLQCDENAPLPVVEHPTVTPVTPAPTAPQRARTQRPVSTNLNPNFTFENFIIGSSNQMAHAAAFATAQSPGRVYNPLFIYGGVGLGKTHLMQAIGHAVAGRDAGKHVLYISCERFLNQYIEAIQNETAERGTLTKFRDFYRNAVDVLLIDDIQFLSNKERMQEEFHHTFNALHNEGKQVVMTSDKSPHELEHIESRLVNRFEWGMVVDIQSPDFETRVAIINKKLEQFGHSLDSEIVYYLANRVRNDVRKIEGAIIKLLGYASVQNTPITLEVVRECLKDYISSQTVTLESIQKAVVDFFDLRLSDLRGNRRPKAISHPRQLAMYLCRDLTDSSLTEIAQSFGGKDHTTVLYACRKIDALRTRDDVVGQQLQTLKKRILENKYAS